MIEIVYHNGRALPYVSEQCFGFENAEGNGSIHCYRLLDGVSVMLMRLELESYTEVRTQTGRLEINFCAGGRFETHFSLRDHVLLKPGDMAISCYDGLRGARSESHFPLGYYEGVCLLQLKVLELMMLLDRIPREGSGDAYCSAKQVELVRHIRGHLLSDRDGYVSLAELAEEHEISVSHLQKLFMQIYDAPVYRYIKEYRLERAAVELVRSSESVTVIAQNAGYDNASKFSEAFKKRYGMTPTHYRSKAKRSVKTE